MLKSDGQQLSFNFQKNARDMMPDDITLDELLYVLKNHSGSEIERYYYFEQISEHRNKK
ncbi:MAG: hypothetical protein ACI88H_001901 [Cocleimonas sp.]|jgi:hypothetical protein